MVQNPDHSPSPDALRLLEESISSVREALTGLKFGNVSLTVHEGRVGVPEQRPQVLGVERVATDDLGAALPELAQPAAVLQDADVLVPAQQQVGDLAADVSGRSPSARSSSPPILVVRPSVPMMAGVAFLGRSAERSGGLSRG